MSEQFNRAMPNQVDNPWAAPAASAPSASPLPPPPLEAYASATPPTGRQWPYASWGARVGGSLIDSLLVLVGGIPYVIGLVLLAASGGNSSTSSAGAYAPEPSSGDASLALAGLGLLLVGGLLMLGIWLWNRVFTMGRTGQSVGKRAMRLYLVSERTGNPMGPGMCFVRELVHYVDGIMYLGYLWPLWDPKKQTFADKVVSTVVAQAPRPQI